MTISFADRVAIVTGSGGGLGRAYAIELAARGARVVVNDLAADAAQSVVDEIITKGGEAIAAPASVTDAEAMAAIADSAKARWGGVHILINNAGIVRDRSFSKMSLEDWRLVVDVHLNGAANATKAVWDMMREQNYGRILMTASATGLYGNFGQSNYGAAKMGLAGFTKSLHQEGVKNNIRVNTIVPVAATSMTANVMPENLKAGSNPAKVAPVALYLVSEDAPSNIIAGAGGGFVHAAYVTMTKGVVLDDAELTVEGVAARWTEIADRSGETVPATLGDQIRAAGAAATR